MFVVLLASHGNRTVGVFVGSWAEGDENGTRPVAVRG